MGRSAQADRCAALIDGYNVMYALGLLGKRLGPDGFRKVRTRFLNDLADALGAVEAHLTTVVFDAADPPGDLPRATTHKGLSVVFAVDDENADERIEQLIAEHSSPRDADRRLVRSPHPPSRDPAQGPVADRRRVPRPSSTPASAASPSNPRPATVTASGRWSPEEAAFWLEEFRDLAESPETRDAFERTTGIPHRRRDRRDRARGRARSSGRARSRADQIRGVRPAGYWMKREVLWYNRPQVGAMRLGTDHRPDI